MAVVSVGTGTAVVVTGISGGGEAGCVGAIDVFTSGGGAAFCSSL